MCGPISQTCDEDVYLLAAIRVAKGRIQLNAAAHLAVRLHVAQEAQDTLAKARDRHPLADVSLCHNDVVLERLSNKDGADAMIRTAVDPGKYMAPKERMRPMPPNEVVGATSASDDLRDGACVMSDVTTSRTWLRGLYTISVNLCVIILCPFFRRCVMTSSIVYRSTPRDSPVVVTCL